MPEAARIEMPEAGILKLTGRIDLVSISELHDIGNDLLAESDADLILDLDEASFRGAAGLVLIAAWLKNMMAQQRKLILKNVPESLIRIARAYGMLKILKLEDKTPSA